MESFKNFDPKDPKYKKVEDLPRIAKPDYRDVEGGFITKEAEESDIHSEKQAYRNKLLGRDIADTAEDLQRRALRIDRAREKSLEILGGVKPEGAENVLIKIFYPKKKIISGDGAAEDDYNMKEFLRTDVSLYRKAVKIDPQILEYAEPIIVNDKEVIMSAVSQDGNTIRFASKRLQNDPEIIVKALNQNRDAEKYITEAGADRLISEN